MAVSVANLTIVQWVLFCLSLVPQFTSLQISVNFSWSSLWLQFSAESSEKCSHCTRTASGGPTHIPTTVWDLLFHAGGLASNKVFTDSALQQVILLLTSLTEKTKRRSPERWFAFLLSCPLQTLVGLFQRTKSTMSGQAGNSWIEEQLHFVLTDFSGFSSFHLLWLLQFLQEVWKTEIPKSCWHLCCWGW